MMERDYQSLVEMVKLEEDTNEKLKKQLLSTSTKLEMQFFESNEKERSKKGKYKKMLEEAKSELVMKKQKLMLAKRKKKEEYEKNEKKYVELAEKFGAVEAQHDYLKSIYDAEEAASGSPNTAMSGIGARGSEV